VEVALKAFMSSKVRDHLEGDSLRSYRSLTGILLEWLRARKMHAQAISGISEAHARAFMDDAYTVRELGNRTYNNYLQFYISLWNWFQSERYVGSNVFAGLKRKKVSKEAKSFRPPTEHERGLIRAYLEREQPRFLTFVLLCFHMGIRPKEAFMLKPRDFHLKGQAIVVDGSVSKNDRTQGVAIPNNLMPHLLALKLEEQHPDHYVFSSGFEPGPLLRDSRVSGKAWERMRGRIGLAKEVTMYQVKHAGAVAIARAGLGAVDLMNHLRHHDLAMTTIYTNHSDLEGVRAVLDKEVRF
jgi:integrase